MTNLEINMEEFLRLYPVIHFKKWAEVGSFYKKEFPFHKTQKEGNMLIRRNWREYSKRMKVLNERSIEKEGK